MVSRSKAPFRWEMLLVLLAGVWTLFHLIWSVAGVKGYDYWDVGLLILFVLTLIVAFVHYAQERPALAAAPSSEPFPEPAITKFFLASVGSAELWFVVRMWGPTGCLQAGTR